MYQLNAYLVTVALLYKIFIWPNRSRSSDEAFSLLVQQYVNCNDAVWSYTWWHVKRKRFTASTTVRFLPTPDRSSNSAQHHWWSIISCDCRTSMEQSSYQRHCINFSTVFQQTTWNIFIYQIFPITLNCFLIFVYRVLEATLPSLCHVNQYVLLLLLHI